MPFKNPEERRRYMKKYFRERRARKKRNYLTLKETVEDLRNMYDRPFIEELKPQKLERVVEAKPLESPTDSQLLAQGFERLMLATQTQQRIMSVEGVDYQKLVKVYESYISDILTILYLPNLREQHKALLPLLIGIDELILVGIDYREKYYSELFEPERQKWEGYRLKIRKRIATFKKTLQYVENLDSKKGGIV